MAGTEHGSVRSQSSVNCLAIYVKSRAECTMMFCAGILEPERDDIVLISRFLLTID
ncbi:MAG: hypothetical protein IKU25_07230 [Clostridia bacterium]|nr:hypothetical protein [Clostridia bacterium]